MLTLLKKTTAATLAFASIVLATNPSAVAAEGYPEKPITWIVPDGAGGGLDTVVRTIYPYIAKNLPNDATFVLKNLPGATQTIAVSAVYEAEPDGYTIGQASVAPLTIMPHLGKTTYASFEDFELIANVFDAAHYLVVPGDSPFKTLEELLAFAKENPGKVRVGLDGVYNVQHLPLLSLEKTAGVDLNEITYKSSAETKKALLGGEIEAGIVPSHIIIAESENGSIKPIVDVMEVKPDYFADIPSLKDLGFTPSQLFVGVIAPKGTPQDIQDILATAIDAALKDPELIDALTKRQIMINFNDSATYKSRMTELDTVNKGILTDLGILK
ncbi:Bug family tripartite tricarboxylate transporter substrate binding protein [Pseudorhodobacter wandonensis]|jgi:tripartite-type tricarboxylate transporter receptor subunit TctC|uniref:Bug family tripartite tricarboxylate transporter substrate binding protein n=1 Tax=Pseudorhodobacter wandonensis TaxID=1120568 RepID=UPI00067B6145|nr:tripartite tricarboxylate transporter substrate binding protein [Pseudorhodobacter wandonensis]